MILASISKLQSDWLSTCMKKEKKTIEEKGTLAKRLVVNVMNVNVGISM